MNLTNEEKETHLNMVAANRTIWEISTDDEVIQRKLEKVGATLVRVGNGGLTKFYTLPAKSVRFVRERKISDEERARLSQRMRKLLFDQASTSSKVAK